MKAFSQKFVIEELFPVFAAILVVDVLFWMDEGYYDFRWMSSPGNWFMFLVYTGGLVAGELIISKLISQHYSTVKRTAATIMLGIPLGFGLALAGVFGLGLIVRVLI